ncbi:hypothetical protein H0X09_00980 [Candidatus Saccharibacteria bacterium]|nr:hypothetical protein [Candidatus Saccharibacteria bacterium]
MTTSIEANFSRPTTNLKEFERMDEVYGRHPVSGEDKKLYGTFVLENTCIIQTPPDVLERGLILTNPSQIETIYRNFEGTVVKQDFAYFRREPTSLHIGKTESVPYIIANNANGVPKLLDFPEAKTLEGEDPRITRNVRFREKLGWCISTVVATPHPDDPAEVLDIKQVFHWGESLATLEPVWEVPNLKNTCIYPVGPASEDAGLDVFGRPHPHISYTRVNDFSEITEDRINSSLLITEGKLLPGIHSGVNFVKGVKAHINHRVLDVHEAYAPITEEGKTLHYRLARYGFELPTHNNPQGRLVLLGVIATRNQFPNAEPKPPENGVYNYNDVLYGSMGTRGKMVTGIADRHIGYASVIRTA